MEDTLKERLEIYRRSKTVAENEGNSSKARRYGRICKQFEDALKLFSKGKSVPIDELPTPPGFPSLGELMKQPTPAAPETPKVSLPPTTESNELNEQATSALPSTDPATPVAPPRTNSGIIKKKKI